MQSCLHQRDVYSLRTFCPALDYSIDFNGRVGNKPIRWDYLNDASRKRIYEVTSILGWLKNTQASYSTSNYIFNANGGVKLYKVTDASLNTVCVANFNVKLDSIVPVFQHTGVWYEIFTGDSINVLDVQQKIKLQAGEYKFYVDKQLIPPTTLTSIQTKNKNTMDVEIYPNPMMDEITLEWTSSEAPVNIEVYDLLGKKLFNKRISSTEGFEVLTKSELDLMPGTYIITLQQSEKTYKQKIIIL